jgi:hypothetical protein
LENTSRLEMHQPREDTSVDGEHNLSRISDRIDTAE